MRIKDRLSALISWNFFGALGIEKGSRTKGPNGLRDEGGKGLSFGGDFRLLEADCCRGFSGEDLFGGFFLCGFFSGLGSILFDISKKFRLNRIVSPPSRFTLGV